MGQIICDNRSEAKEKEVRNMIAVKQHQRTIKYYLKKYPELLNKYSTNSQEMTKEEKYWTMLIKCYINANDNVRTRILVLKYCLKKPAATIQMELFIERTTYFKHHADMIQDIYFLAVLMGLISDPEIDSISKTVEQITQIKRS